MFGLRAWDLVNKYILRNFLRRFALRMNKHFYGLRQVGGSMRRWMGAQSGDRTLLLGLWEIYGLHNLCNAFNH